MSNYCEDLIQYTGINSNLNTKIEYFTQSNISLTFQIPKDKKNISQITKVYVFPEIIQSNIIKTPKGKSYEGQVLTGHKMLINIDVNMKIEYISSDESKSIQYINHKIPSSTYVTIDEDYDYYLSAYPSITIEDIYCKLLSNKRIYTNISLVSVVDVF